MVGNFKLYSLNNKLLRNYSAEKHTSKLLDYKNLPQPQSSQELNERFWNSSEYIRTLKFGVSGLSLEESKKSCASQEEVSNRNNKQEKLITNTQIPPKNNLN